MYKIVITAPAEQDIREAALYIRDKLQNTQAAYSLLDAIDEAVLSLRDMPERFALVGDAMLAGAGFRSVRIKNYLIFYVARSETETVTIERFLYARRNWLELLRQNKEGKNKNA